MSAKGGGDFSDEGGTVGKSCQNPTEGEEKRGEAHERTKE